jgi:hypothetical protein
MPHDSDDEANVDLCVGSLGIKCTDEQLQQALKEHTILFDPARLKVTLNAFKDENGNVLCADLSRRGFGDFITRTASRNFYIGQCVSSRLDSLVGVITQITDDGTTFHVTVPNRSGEGTTTSVQIVPEKMIRPCKNLDLTKKNTQTNYLEALAERVGANPSDGTKWRDQVPLVMQEDFGDTNEWIATPWAGSFAAYCDHANHRPAIQQISKAGSWSMEDAGIISFCLNYSHVLASSVRDSRPDYGALLHKYYNMMARRASATVDAPTKEGGPSAATGSAHIARQTITTAAANPHASGPPDQLEATFPESYRHLAGGAGSPGSRTGLADIEPGWATILDGDPRGFRGFTGTQ